MAGPFFQVGAVAMCPHGGQVMAVSANVRVLAGGAPVVMMSDQCTVVGCVFTVGGAPMPCVKVIWTVPTVRALVNGQPAVTAASVGMCLAATGAPNGPAVVALTQTMAVAT